MTGTNRKDDGLWRFRAKFVLWCVGTIFWLTIISGSILWWGLPTWAPNFVVEKSPWIEPAMRAAIKGNNQKLFLQRRSDFGDTFKPAMCDSLQYGTLEEKKLAIRALKAYPKDEHCVSALILALQDVENVVVEDAIEVLVQLSDSRIYAPVLAAMQKMTLKINSASYLYVMGENQDPEFYKLIEQSYLQSTNPKERLLACFAFHARNHPETANLFRDHIGIDFNRAGLLYRDDGDAIGFLLGYARFEGSLILIEELMNDPSALHRSGGVIAAGIKGDLRFAPAILNLLSDENNTVKFDAVNAVGKIYNEAIHVKLQDLAIHESNDDIAITAIHTLKWGRHTPINIRPFLSLPVARRIAFVQSIDIDYEFTQEERALIDTFANDADKKVLVYYLDKQRFLKTK